MEAIGRAWRDGSALGSLLLKKGTDVKAKDNDGKTAEHYAAENGSKHVVLLLRHIGR